MSETNLLIKYNRTKSTTLSTVHGYVQAHSGLNVAACTISGFDPVSNGSQGSWYEDTKFTKMEWYKIIGLVIKISFFNQIFIKFSLTWHKPIKNKQYQPKVQ